MYGAVSRRAFLCSMTTHLHPSALFQIISMVWVLVRNEDTVCIQDAQTTALEPSPLINLIFQLLEVVSRYRDPQLQVTENYLYL